MRGIKEVILVLIYLSFLKIALTQNQKWVDEKKALVTFDFLDTSHNRNNQQIVTIQLSLTNLTNKAIYFTSNDFYQDDFIYPWRTPDSCIIEFGENKIPRLSDIKGTGMLKLAAKCKYKLTGYIYLKDLSAQLTNTTLIINYIDNDTIIKKTKHPYMVYQPKGKKKIHSHYYIDYSTYQLFCKTLKFSFAK
jgi:hypothetical protein